MKLKKLFMESINPHITRTIKECHKHMNFFVYDPKNSFPVIIYYYEYPNDGEMEFSKKFIKIEMGKECIDSWSNPDDLYQQINDALTFALLVFLNKKEVDTDACIEDVMEQIWSYTQDNGIEISDPD